MCTIRFWGCTVSRDDLPRGTAPRTHPLTFSPSCQPPSPGEAPRQARPGESNSRQKERHEDLDALSALVSPRRSLGVVELTVPVSSPAPEYQEVRLQVRARVRACMGACAWFLHTGTGEAICRHSRLERRVMMVLATSDGRPAPVCFTPQEAAGPYSRAPRSL